MSARVVMPALALVVSALLVAGAGAETRRPAVQSSHPATDSLAVPSPLEPVGAAAGMGEPRAAPLPPPGPVGDSAVLASCEGAPIRSIEVRCLNIFDPVPPGRFQGVYGAANRLHVRTRSSTVRGLLLFRPGETWSAERVRESERKLREIEYIEPAPILSRRDGDSVDVLVVTRDQWTTQPELNLERGGGRTFGSVGITERNLFGLGLGISLLFREDPTGRTRTGSLSTRRLFGTPLEGTVKAGTGTGGVSTAFSVSDPFLSLGDTRSWTLSVWRSSVDQQLFRSGSVVADFPFRFERAQLEYAVGSRTPEGLVRRFAFGFTQFDRHYGATVPASGQAGVPPGGEEELKLRSLTGRVTFWSPRYIQRRGVELFDPIEDFDVGSRVGMEGGFILRALGSTADEGYARLRLEAGRETRRFGFGFVHGNVSTRVRAGARETLALLDARWVQQPLPDVALVVAAHGDAADQAPRETQFIVGGLNGLRAFPVQALAGSQVWRFNAETRWVALRGLADVVSLGGAAFVDAARAWGPGGDREPWHHDAGFGLRLSFPHASLHQVARFDVAFPLSPTRDGRREPVFSFGSSQAF